MAATQVSTREELRKNAGHLLGAMKELEADDTGATNTFITDELPLRTTDLKGKHLIFTSGQSNIDGQIRQIISSSVSANRVTLTFFPVVSNAPVDGATAEMWDEEYDPVRVHDAINEAVNDATGYIFTPTTDISLHTGGRDKTRFDLIGTLDMIDKVELRTGMIAEQVVVPGLAWSESVASSFVVTQDEDDRIYGLAATKFVFTPGNDGDLVSTTVVSNGNLSGKTHYEFGIKADIGVAASDLVIRLSATANGADIDKIIAIPALAAGVEQWIRVAMDEVTSGFTPDEAAAIVSVAFEYNANNKANTFWITGHEATLEDSYTYDPVASHLWSIDKANRDLVFDMPASILGYRLMKLTGGDNPLQLALDADVTEIPERYITHYAVGTLLSRPIRGESAEQARVRQSWADRQMGMAESAKGAFPMLINARFTN